MPDQMNENALIEVLSKLAQVDIDALHVYNQASKEVEDEVIRGRIEEFRSDHRKHIDILSGEIRTLGGNPPELSRDFKGFVIEGFTALRSLTGMKAALKALKTTEKITCRYYGEAIPKDLPDPVKDILRKHFSDEKVHLDYFDSNLHAIS